MAQVTLADVTLDYEVNGPADGEPVVLLAGCGGPAAGWFGVMPGLLDAGYRVVTFDNRGLAPSSSPPAPYSIEQMVDDTLGLCDHLGLGRAHFAGHSMGGWITELLAARHADRTLTATMMGSCNATTSWERVVTIAERDLARFTENPTPMMQAADVLRYLPKFAVAEQRHRRRMGRAAGRFGAVGESRPPRTVRGVPRLVRALG